VTDDGGKEASQKMTTLRRIYQHAIETPNQKLESIWEEYVSFENSVAALGSAGAKTLSREILSRMQTKVANSKKVYQERVLLYKDIDQTALAIPQGDPEGEVQLRLWKKVLAYETKNPQSLDENPHRAAIASVYQQCLMNMRHYIEIWDAFARVELQSENFEGAASIYSQGTKAVSPKSELLYLVWADMEEKRKETGAAKEVYEHLIADAPSPLGYIHHIRFARRQEGGQDTARKVFMKAKKSPHCSWQVYVTYAMIEAYCNKEDTVAKKIFELGLKEHLTEPKYVCRYIDFLLQLKDVNNMRVLCERALAAMPPEKTPEVWKKLLDFEYAYGDMATIQKQEARKAAMLPELAENKLVPALNQFRSLDLWPCSGDVFKDFANVRAANIAKGAIYGSAAPKTTSSRVKRYNMPNLTSLGKIDLASEKKAAHNSLVPGTVADFIRRLPPGHMFVNSEADIDRLISVIGAYEPPTSGNSTGEKRKLEAMETLNKAPAAIAAPVADVFRQRKLQKSRAGA